MTESTESNRGWFPEGWTHPGDDDRLPWVTHPAPDEPEDQEVPEHEQTSVEVADNGQQYRLHPHLKELPEEAEGARNLVAPAIPGISLSDYSLNPQQKGWGAPCAASHATVQLTAARVTVDARIAELVSLIMRANEKQGYRYRAADTGAYNCRYIGGTTIWSNHAWALAIDSNWQTNPQHYPVITDRPRWELDRWNRFGFAWGGDYSGGTIPDAMHTEAMGTPQQMYQALLLARRELTPIITGPTPKPVSSHPPVLRWPLPAGHYVGAKTGPANCHGGDPRYDSAVICAFVRNVLEWFVYHGVVRGVAPSSWATTRWTLGGWDAAATDPVAEAWHARFYPHQPYPAQIWSDDYARLARP